ncbi:hypothetical protein N658DRAFT_489095 [Parathielavia hyrcaniae]|uniref:Secreted protein n=1 Tax=Parathielavia hyrcaniae TaxID=113614 RepID=A0AAN6PTM4_9PEZI|nr:hypothetical protein N658DRAFT_489095 [Parathielavia hyrcaniae]
MLLLVAMQLSCGSARLLSSWLTGWADAFQVVWWREDQSIMAKVVGPFILRVSTEAALSGPADHPVLDPENPEHGEHGEQGGGGQDIVCPICPIWQQQISDWKV